MQRAGMMELDSTTPRDLRVQIAKYWDKPLYHLAFFVGIHPVQLSAVLHGRAPLKPELTHKILRVLHIESEGTGAR